MLTKPRYFGVIHKNENVRMSSRSGGAFTALSDYVLQNDGVVYGCILNDVQQAVHIRTVSSEERNQMRGSKYVQSDMGTCFEQVRKDLCDGRKVLFSGTSCQVDGLKSFLAATKTEGWILMVDILCHGTPSPLLWQEYLWWHEEKSGKKILKADFRDKKQFGWKGHVETVTFEDGTAESLKVYAHLFYTHNVMRPSCHICPYSQLTRKADITLADFWGWEKTNPAANTDNKGISLLIISTQQGIDIFNEVRTSLNAFECKEENCIQPPLLNPSDAPLGKKKFWKEYYEKGFNHIQKKYGHDGCYEAIKKLMPLWLLKKLKKLILRHK